MRARLPEYERYHLAQYDKPYDSTLALERFIRAQVRQPDGIFMDVGCGAGSVVRVLADTRLLDLCGVVGVDSDAALLEIAHEHNEGASFICLDFNDPLPRCDFSISVQVLSFIEDWRTPLRVQLEATREWAFFTSLFWPGVSTHTHASDKEKRDVHYNVIQVETFEAACRSAGATKIVWQPYEAPKRILAPHDVLRSRTEDERTMSGPLYLPWHLVAVRMVEGTSD